MRPRRLALLPVIAIAALAGGFGAGAARATAAPTICVALVVDGRSLGSDVSTSCAKVAKGSTGVEVLEAAGHSIGYRHDGLICTIDGLPKTGCAGIDANHYWAYFHRSPGSTKWIYSAEGAGTYQPANASTDGWVFGDGTADPPENVPYAQICTPTATPSPTPTPTHAATKKAAPIATPKAGKTHHPTVPSQTASPSATPAPRSSAPRSSAPRSSTPRPSAPQSSASGEKQPPHPAATKTSAPSPSTPTPTISTSATGQRTGLVIGVIVAIGLGILALVRFRRPPR